jgi:hypothetical protein
MGWIILESQTLNGEKLDGKGRYIVIDPDDLYNGMSYSEWTSNWFNWFLSADADRRNSGPVVFLRSKGIPNEKTGAGISDVQTLTDVQTLANVGSGSYPLPDSPAADVTGMTTPSKLYVNDPNIKIGGDRLQIFEDQAVLVPIHVCFWLKTTPYADWGSMQDHTGLTIDNGDNPPDVSQLTINGMEIELPITQEIREEEKVMVADLAAVKETLADIKKGQKTLADIKKEKGEKITLADIKELKINLVKELKLMERFRITTPIFTAVVPEAQYGRSAKDFIEESPIVPGSYPAMVDGYFVMFKFKPGTYWVHSWASAPRETRGPYFSELLYQIEVHKRRPRYGMITRWRPSRNERVLNQILEQKKRTGDLTNPEMNRFKTYFTTNDKSERQSIV